MTSFTVRLLLFTTISSAALASTAAHAQRSSLYARNEQGMIPLASASLTYREVPPPREIKLHDIVTIVVLERSQSTNKSKFDGKKNASIDAQLKSWIELDGLNLKPAPQADGDPRANGVYNSLYKAEGNLETKQALQFTISATVVDIRPNGNLVLEARKSVKDDDEGFEAWVTGIVRREDIDPRNHVTSDAIAELSVGRTTVGQVRDSYRRGWLHKLYARFAPF